MGGSSGPTRAQTAGLSGAGGGRILPGSAPTDYVPWVSAGGPSYQPVPTAAVFNIDRRYQTVGSDPIWYERPGAPPSAAGQAGRGVEFVAVNVASTLSATGFLDIFPASGAGGGWGAAGGNSLLTNTGYATIGTSYGGAAGKAINTAGNTVTWIGGSNRVYGAVG